LRKIIYREGFDVVHTHLPTADTFGRTAALLARESKIKIISTIHNMDEWKLSAGFQYIMLKLFNRFTVNRFKRVSLVAVSNAVKDFTIARERIRSEKITVINNFINYADKHIDDFHFDANGRFVISTVGRLDITKGHPLLLDAMNKLCNERNYKNILLLILGSGDLRDELEEITRRDDLTENVSFLGFNKNIFDYLCVSNLFVLASKIEGQSLAVLEAFYCRTPALCSDIAANAEVMEYGKNGILFKDGDAADLADKIENVINNNYDLEELKERAFVYCSDLTIEKHINQLLSLYEK